MDENVRDRLLAFIESTSDFVGVTDDSGNVVYLNDAALRRLGRTRDETTSLTTADLFTEAMFDRYFEEIRPALLRSRTWSGVLSARTATGEAVDAWMTVVGGVGPGGDIEWLVTSGRDVTEWIHDRDAWRWRATHDELTGVGRRSVLTERLDDALARARRSGELVCVLFVDVDDFKEVNDAYGHDAGDMVLAELGRRLIGATREVDTVVRVGGDEFVVVAEGITDAHLAEEFAQRLKEHIVGKPVTIGVTNLPLSVSVGLAVGTGECDGPQLLREADVAMYQAKAARDLPLTAHQVEASQPSPVTVHRVSVALTQQLIIPHYQPIVRLVDGTVVGYQALARWGQDSSAGFVQVVQDSAVAAALDMAILRRATVDAAWWEQMPRPNMHVHLSGRLLAGREGVSHIQEVLQQSGLPPDRLTLEIPEAVVFEGGHGVTEALAALHEMGVRLAASHVLCDEPPDPGLERLDEIVMDQIVVEGLSDRENASRTLIESAHARGLSVIAVGIETDDQRRLLVESGCDFGTGLLFGAPKPR